MLIYLYILDLTPERERERVGVGWEREEKGEGDKARAILFQKKRNYQRLFSDKSTPKRVHATTTLQRNMQQAVKKRRKCRKREQEQA